MPEAEHSAIVPAPNSGRDYSLIGRDVELMADGRRPSGYQLVLGDFSRVRVP